MNIPSPNRIVTLFEAFFCAFIYATERHKFLFSAQTRVSIKNMFFFLMKLHHYKMTGIFDKEVTKNIKASPKGFKK